MNYTHTITLIAPLSLLSIASAISRSLDPDVGGADSWQTVDDTITVKTPCTEQFCNQALYLIANPEALHAAVSADYSARWPHLTPPTIGDCEQFCGSVVVQNSKEI
jgi:hypothetical protein